ncbi:MAG: hypothetical protein ABI988_12155, partial [Nitrospirota bacterium]
GFYHLCAGGVLFMVRVCLLSLEMCVLFRMGKGSDRPSIFTRSPGPSNLLILSSLSPAIINLSQIIFEPRLSIQRGSADSLGRRLDE